MNSKETEHTLLQGEVEEDAAQLKFTKEFESVGCDALLTSEVYMLLEHRRQQSERKEEIEDLPEVFVKTLNYTRRLAQFRNRDAIRAVRAVFADKPLHKVEVAQLANLLPDTIEEAKSLIQSLENGRIDDEQLEEILRELNAKKTFQ